jgi:hypothetical protein
MVSALSLDLLYQYYIWHSWYDPIWIIERSEIVVLWALVPIGIIAVINQFKVIDSAWIEYWQARKQMGENKIRMIVSEAVNSKTR